MVKLLVAIDSFKGCATTTELNQALIESINHPQITEKINIPIADGGEGTLEALKESLKGKYYTKQVPDLLGCPIDVEYLVTKIDGVRTAFVESAKVIGIDRIEPSEITIQTANSYGLGMLIKTIIDSGIKQIYITLGGSGTSDGGLGFLRGLGVLGITDDNKNPLLTTEKIDISLARTNLKEVNLIAMADVTNTYTGENGFSLFFGPQKGGTKELLYEMDERAENIAQQLSSGLKYDISDTKGSGAAGGLGGAILSLGGKIQSGFDTISQLISLEEHISKADVVITGEGKIDEQTSNGKVPYGVANLCKKYNKPVFAVCGMRTEDIGIMSDLLLGAFSIHMGPIGKEEAMEHDVTIRNLKITGRELVNLFLKTME